MNENHRLKVKLIHCGNRNISNPEDNLEKYIFYMPMGIISLSSQLKAIGFDVQLLHLDLEKAPHIEEIIDLASLDAVGFACHWANQSRVVLDIAQLIKERKPGVFIFLGGYTASFFAKEILSGYSFIDAVIRGDGEIPITELCEALEENIRNNDNRLKPRTVSFEKVQNLAWKGNDNEIIINKLSYISSVEEINRFDFAAIDLLKNWQFYRKLSRYWTKFTPINTYPLFLLEIGRGCPYGCAYCGGNHDAQSLITGRKGQVVRSLASVISTIEKGISFGYSCFFTCFEFEGSDQWYIELFRLLKEKSTRVSFAYESWRIPSKKLIDVMSESCQQVIFTVSPDSANENLRKKNKDKRLFYSNLELEECLDHISTKNNVKIQVYFGYFIPFEEEMHVYETMDFITRLFHTYSQYAEIVYMNFNTDPGSSLFINPGKYDFNLSVHYFRDFVRKLEVNYQTKKGKRPGMTLLSFPNSFTGLQAVNLANKINLFNNLFCFEKSIRELLKKTGRLNVFSGYLKKINLSFARENDMTITRVKDVLLEICKQHLPRESNIIDIIDEEFNRIPYKSLIKNLTHFYTLDSKMPGLIPGAKKNKILSKIKNSKEKVVIDFDLE